MTKPNILIIHTDMQSCWTLSSYGGKLVETPHIDSIGHAGAILDNFFCNSAVCTPSRGTLLTGLFPNKHGACKNNRTGLHENIKTLGHVFRDNGYRTVYTGKWHLEIDNGRPGWMPDARNRGFDDSRFMFNISHGKMFIDTGIFPPEVSKTPGDHKTYMTDALTDIVIDKLKEQDETPFFYFYSIPDPHHPYKVRSPYSGMYDPLDMPLPESFYHEEHPPKWIANSAYWEKAFSRFPVSREQFFKNAKAAYCGMVKCVDDNIGRLLTALEANGQAENTLVIFTSDHGDFLGHHGLMEKGLPYDEVYRIPFLIRYPGHIQAGMRYDNLLSNVDIRATLKGLTGITDDGDQDGKDFSKLLLDGEQDIGDSVHIQYLNSPKQLHAGLVNKDYFLSLMFEQEESGKIIPTEHVLWDRQRDPEQVNNLFYQDAYAGVIKELLPQIFQNEKALDSPLAAPLKELCLIWC